MENFGFFKKLFRCILIYLWINVWVEVLYSRKWWVRIEVCVCGISIGYKECNVSVEEGVGSGCMYRSVLL